MLSPIAFSPPFNYHDDDRDDDRDQKYDDDDDDDDDDSLVDAHGSQLATTSSHPATPSLTATTHPHPPHPHPYQYYLHSHHHHRHPHSCSPHSMRHSMRLTLMSPFTVTT